MKKIMISLMIVAAILSLSSCTKSSGGGGGASVSESNGTITATVNGVATSWSGYAEAVKISNDIYYELGIEGATSSSALRTNSIQLKIVSYSPITAVTYSTNFLLSSGSVDCNIFKAGNNYVTSPYVGTPNFSVSITSINSSSVSGNFSGTVYYEYTNTVAEIITNGVFKVKF